MGSLGFSPTATSIVADDAAAPSPPANVTPKQGTVAFFKARLTGLPDLKVTIEAMVTDKDHVAASFVYTGTHKGTYFGIAPSGRSLRFTSCDIFRGKDGSSSIGVWAISQAS